MIYATGTTSVPKSYDLAKEYLSRVKSDRPEVRFYLALSNLESGEKVNQSIRVICNIADEGFDKAQEWIRDNLESPRFDSIVRFCKFKSDDTDAIVQVARVITEGNPLAMIEIREGVSKGHAEVLYVIGTFYRRGTYVERSDDMAMMWYLKAETHQSYFEMARIAEESGLDTVFEYYYRAASAGNCEAMSRLLSESSPEARYYVGKIYNSQGHAKQAMDEMNRAARQGYEPAIQWIRTYESKRREEAERAKRERKRKENEPYGGVSSY